MNGHGKLTPLNDGSVGPNLRRVRRDVRSALRAKGQVRFLAARRPDNHDNCPCPVGRGVGQQNQKTTTIAVSHGKSIPCEIVAKRSQEEFLNFIFLSSPPRKQWDRSTVAAR